MFAWGIQAIVTQSLLMREALVLMSGSELAWGIVLFAWLLGVAVGASVGSLLSPRLKRPHLALVIALLVLGALAGVEIWAFRGARSWMGVAPGELLPLPKTALAAVVLVSPCSALVGLAFPLACAVRAAGPGDAATGAGPLAGVYALESAGSLVGGAVFSFWAIEHASPIQIAMFCAAITLAAAATLLSSARQRSPALLCALMAAFAVAGAIVVGPRLDRSLIQQRWQSMAPGYELCAEAESRYQNLAVGRRVDQYTLYSDGQVSSNFPDPYGIAPQVHFWMCQHPSPRRVLVLGGGAEGVLAEILRHPVEHVDYIEPDPRQIDIVEPFLPAADRAALRNPRVTVHHTDGRHFVKTCSDRYDLVIARLPEPTSALRARFYTDEFYRELHRVTQPRAILCMTAAAVPTHMTAASARYLASIRTTLRQSFPHVLVGWGDPAQVLAATEPDLIATEPTELQRRYRERRVESPWFDPLWFDGATDWFDPLKVRQRADELDAVVEPPVSTDLQPIAYMLRLALWERMATGRTGRIIEWLLDITWRPLAAVLAAMAGLLLILFRLRRGASVGWREGAIAVSVASTGFATMALSIIWLFAFQNLYGYVYQRIGWIIALFMAGLVVGCAWTDRKSKRLHDPVQLPAYLWRHLIAVDLLLAALSLSIPAVLPVLGAIQASPGSLVIVEWSVSLLVLATGLLGGAAFALAGGLQLQLTGRSGSAAGTVVAVDHAGACLGALATGVLLVPVLGTATAAILLAGMKLASAAVLIAGQSTRCWRRL
ncbi:MAG TPA: hypothetical protein VLM89_12730 [Phycisphaerae bacterium]|nr:hypothetical protein [Phycisphaerae bacterium]